MKKVLITGSDGFVGSILRQSFKSAGFEVLGTVFFREGEEDEVRLDITRSDSLQALPQQAFDIVIHTVGIVDQNAPKELMYSVNSDGTQHLLDWCKKVGCGHFIHISSIGVYGLRSIGENRIEDKTKTVGLVGVPYQKSKALAESYVSKSGLPYTMLRLPVVIGSGDTFFSPTMRLALNTGNYFFYSRKDPLVSLLFVENLPSMLFKIIEKKPTCQIFNAGCHDVTWREIIEEYARCMNINIDRRPLRWRYALQNLNNKSFLLTFTCAFFGQHFPADKLRNMFDWEPPYSWQVGVQKASISRNINLANQ